ncbi:MAG: hypothetical protein K5912_04515 [Alphaproteobacteria bacterium]|nr:hypothetical protein [Alphaproteobacteria bacterium]
MFTLKCNENQEVEVLSVAALLRDIKCVINPYGDEYFYVMPWNEFGHSNWIETWVAFRRNGARMRLHKSRHYKRMVLRMKTDSDNGFVRNVYYAHKHLKKSR